MGIEGGTTAINAEGLDFRRLNELVRQAEGDADIFNCMGQRFIGTALSGKKITLNGICGNALGAYLDGAELVVNGNVQDAAGDTMNGGRIIIKGSAGDALGYAMRGGKIFVRGDAGYRAGVHMKEYGQTKPVIIVGGRAGSFLGEYLAGGVIIVLDLDGSGASSYEYTGVGMHGGSIYIRSQNPPAGLPCAEPADNGDMMEIEGCLKEFASLFDLDYNQISKSRFYVLRPSSISPYKRLYTLN